MRETLLAFNRGCELPMPNPAMPNPTPSARRRRRPRFSIRTLLLLTAIIAVACGWLGQQVASSLSQRNALNRLNQSVGHVNVGCRPEGAGTESWMHRLCGDDFYPVVYFINLGGTTVTDSELSVFHELPDVVSIDLSSTSIGDGGVSHLKHLKNWFWISGKLPSDWRTATITR